MDRFPQMPVIRILRAIARLSPPRRFSYLVQPRRASGMRRFSAAVMLIGVAVVACSGAPSSQPIDAMVSDSGLDGAVLGCATAAQCDDGIACTNDTCASGACVHVAVPALCAVGETCDLRQGCLAGRVCATTADCTDTDPCHVNVRCDPVSRTCHNDVLDGDGDGYPPRVCGGGDCDDSRASVHPGATEVCNGIDDNCNGLVDEPPAGQECGVGFVCTDGHCTCPATIPLACGAACVDPSSDPANCGACGHVCGTGQSCVAGACACLAGLANCGASCASLASDAANCGSCGTSCGVAGYTTACTGGSCQCTMSGLTFCATAGVRGCVNTQTDAANCGSCGAACAAGTTCVGGVCRCMGTSSVCAGTCTDFATDAANCGACGVGCAAGQMCAGGVCVGCTSAMRSCGATCCMPGATTCIAGGCCANANICGISCCTPGQTCTGTTCCALAQACGTTCCAAGDVCSAGHCCPAGQTNCGGVCVDITTSATHCGTSCAVCPSYPGATPVCTAGVCGYSCTAGFADCNGLASDGCEVNLATDVLHCGACGTNCTGGRTCQGEVCSCRVGQVVCGGVCVTPATDPANCGACGNACAAPANGAVACTGGACVVTCHAGYVLLGEVCTLAPPRAIAPLSTSSTTSQRPTLRWSLASGADGARVQICHDRACATVEQTLDATGTSTAPPTALAAGVHYWRLYGRNAGAVGAIASPTWEFTVGHRSAPVDTSWGSTADFNGDGYADVVVGAQRVMTFTGEAYVYMGSASGLATTPTTTFHNPDGPGAFFGSTVASAGDVNGDGYADLVIGSYAALSATGRAYIYLGSATGLSSTPSTTLTGPDGSGGEFGHSVASAGDLNGDGYADIVVGAPAPMSRTGRAYVYLGSTTGLATTPATTLTGPDGANGLFGVSVAGAGDVNGDGYADIVVGAYAVMSSTGRAYVYVWSATGLATAPTTTLTGPDGANGSFGVSVASADDVNGDGYGDLVVGAQVVMSNTGRAYVYLGSAAGLITTPATTLTGPDGASGSFGASVASAGDVNGDGYSDLVVGAPGVLSSVGRAHIYLGSASGLATTPTTTLNGFDGADSGFGISVASAGDLNADGYADLVVGAFNAMSGTGRAYAFSGSSGGIVTAPTTTLTGPAGVNGFFGGSVASARDHRSTESSGLTLNDVRRTAIHSGPHAVSG